MTNSSIFMSISPFRPTEGPALPDNLSLSLNVSKLPNRKKVGDRRKTTAQGSSMTLPE